MTYVHVLYYKERLRSLAMSFWSYINSFLHVYLIFQYNSHMLLFFLPLLHKQAFHWVRDMHSKLHHENHLHNKLNTLLVILSYIYIMGEHTCLLFIIMSHMIIHSYLCHLSQYKCYNESLLIILNKQISPLIALSFNSPKPT
jgi:hypothetical protein